MARWRWRTVEPRTLAGAVVVIQPGSGRSEPYIGRGSVAVIVSWSARAVADDGLTLGHAEVERGRAAGVGERAALADGRVPRDGPGNGRADGIAAAGLVGGDVLVDVGAVGGLAVAAVGVPRRAGTVAGDDGAVAHGPRDGRGFGGDRDRDAGERGPGVEGLEGGGVDPEPRREAHELVGLGGGGRGRVGGHERELLVDLPGDRREVGSRLAGLVLEQVGVEDLVVVEVGALEVVSGAGNHGIDRGQLIPYRPLRGELLDRHLPHLTPPRPLVGGRGAVGPRCDELDAADLCAGVFVRATRINKYV